MGTGSRAKLLLGFSFLSLGAQAAWPVKTVDLTNGGDDCDSSTEQYLHVEVYDFHDHPKFIMRWRQITGPCGAAVDQSDLLSWEVSYDGASRRHFDDDPPTAGTAGSTNSTWLDIESYSDEGSTLQQRTSWQIKNGHDEHQIWDTVNTDLANDEDYSPTVPGEYTWPFQGVTDYYSTFITAPLPPLECAFSAPAGTAMIGCFADSSSDRLLNSDDLVRNKRGPGGMTAQICSDFCAGYDYFDLEFGRQICYGRCNDGINTHFGTPYGSECWRGVDAVLTKNGEVLASDECDMLCAGTATGEYCGGYDKMTAYQKIQGELPLGPDYIGCYADKPDRAMDAVGKYLVVDMTNEVCISYCAERGYAYAGTQYSVECWCGDRFDRYGEIPDRLCSYPCQGDPEQMCGGSYAISVYSMD